MSLTKYLWREVLKDINISAKQNIYRIKPVYTVSAIISLVLFLVILIVSDGFGKLAVSLAVILALFFLPIVIYMITLRVKLTETSIVKYSLFGSREINMADVTEVSIMPLRGRYLLLLMTDKSHIFISSIIQSYLTIHSALIDRLSIDVKAPLEKISPDMLKKKERTLSIALFLLFTVLAVCAVWGINAGR
jgi:hypothetical protein